VTPRVGQLVEKPYQNEDMSVALFSQLTRLETMGKVGVTELQRRLPKNMRCRARLRSRVGAAMASTGCCPMNTFRQFCRRLPRRPGSCRSLSATVASMCAIARGRSIATTMSFTALDVYAGLSL